MNERQRIFADEYLITRNATRSYMKAYPDAEYNSARASGCELLANPSIAEYISEQFEKQSAAANITAERILKELSCIAFSNNADYVSVIEKDAYTEGPDGTLIPILDADGNQVKYRTVEPKLTSELTEEQQRALEIVQKGRNGFNIRTYDKTKTLELLGKYLGMWDGKVNASGDVGIKVVVDYGEEDERS